MNLVLNRLVMLCVALLLTACGGGADLPAQTQKQAVSQTAVVTQESTQSASRADVGLTASVPGYRASYLVTLTNGTVTVQNLADKSAETYSGIKTLRFVDQDMSFDLSGPDGQVYRLYQAAFNRKPDLEGLGYWIQAARNGVTLDLIGQSFISSEEFRSLYGRDVSADDFVMAAYTNVLHRKPDAAGFNWWADAVKNGLPRSVALTGFSESQENKDYTYDAVRNGLDFVMPPQPGERIRVLRSSYENKTAATAVLGSQWLPPEVATAAAAAYADFFQDGSYSLVTHTLDYVASWDPAKVGSIHFYRRDAAGKWIDKTSALLSDTKGCLHPRKAVVADFNGDGKPDVFLACHGFDKQPYPGEQQRLLLSQPNGTYVNKQLDVNCFCHSASAVDYSGKGYADIVVTDNIIAAKPFFLRNNRDGTFSQDFARLPETGYRYAASVELIDFNRDRRYDIWLGGGEPGSSKETCCSIVPTILMADGVDRFLGSIPIELPTMPEYGFPLDVIYHNNKLYLLRTNVDGGSDQYGFSYYTKSAVQEIDLTTKVSSVKYTHSGPYSNGMQWVNWIILHKGRIQSMDAVYGINFQTSQ